MKTKYHSYEEIISQSSSLELVVDYILENANKIRDFFATSGDIVFVACGSSYWMSLSAHRTMHLFTGKKTYAVKAGDVVMCPDEYTRMYDNPVFLFPSRSGQTKEVLDALDILVGAYQKASILSVTIYPENELMKKSDLSLFMDWPNETSICQTRSFSSLYTAFIMIAAVVGGKEGFISRLREYLRVAPKLYKEHEKEIESIANSKEVTSVVALGSGLQYGLVVEGAYIVIEMAEFASNYYQLLEYRHGPIVTADSGTAVFICSDNNSFEIEAKMAREIRDEGGKVYAIANREVDWADITFSLEGDYDKEITALHFTFVLQLFAYYFSIDLGRNPDSPGNLVPFIIY